MDSDKTDDKTDDFLFKGLVVVLIIVLGFLMIYSYLNVKPETFTQVYLIPDKIVNSAQVDEKIQVVFEIDNREDKTVEYEYKMFFEGEQVNFLKELFQLKTEKKRELLKKFLLLSQLMENKNLLLKFPSLKWKNLIQSGSGLKLNKKVKSVSFF